jgi:hypothetical protein
VAEYKIHNAFAELIMLILRRGDYEVKESLASGSEKTGSLHGKETFGGEEGDGTQRTGDQNTPDAL